MARVIIAFLVSVLLSSSAFGLNISNGLSAIRDAASSVKDGEGRYIDLYAVNQRRKDFSGCTDLFPQGRPINIQSIDSKMKPVGLCSDQFAVLYSGTSKTPLVVVEKLTRESLVNANYERTNDFYPDPRLARSERAELSDFKGSGMDRGHMAPAGDTSSENAMAQSFALSNMILQHAYSNQHVWKKIESDVRKYVKRSSGNVYVFTGPLFDNAPKKLGHSQVWMPSRIFKLVYAESTGTSWAYIQNNDDGQAVPPVSYDEFVAITGYRLLSGIQR